MRKYLGSEPDHIHSWGKAGEILFVQTKEGAHYFLPTFTPTDTLIGRNVFEFKFQRAQKMLLVQYVPVCRKSGKTDNVFVSVAFDRLIDKEQWPFFNYYLRPNSMPHYEEIVAQARSYVTQQLARQHILARFTA